MGSRAACLLLMLTSAAFADHVDLPPFPDADASPNVAFQDPNEVEPLFPELNSRPPAPPSLPQAESGEIDLRPPLFDPLKGFIPSADPSWLNDVIDDHALIWREVRSDLEIIPRDGDGLGITSLNFKGGGHGVSGPLWVETFFGWHFLSGPRNPDVRPQVYELGLEVNFAQPVNELWGLHLQLTPMLATDFANKSDDAFRLAAGGLVTFAWSPDLKLVGGLTYLNRPDLNFLPIVGIRWQPRDDVELDLLVPRPRIAWRYGQDEVGEAWLYLGGEVGGGSWAVKTGSGLKDRMGYRDLRLLVGVESRTLAGDRSMLEAGYVFDRRLEFDRGPGTRNLGGTAVIRWGRSY